MTSEPIIRTKIILIKEFVTEMFSMPKVGFRKFYITQFSFPLNDINVRKVSNKKGTCIGETRDGWSSLCTDPDLTCFETMLSFYFNDFLLHCTALKQEKQHRYEMD